MKLEQKAPSTNLTFDTKSVTQLCLAASELAIHLCDRPCLNAPCMSTNIVDFVVAHTYTSDEADNRHLQELRQTLGSLFQS